MLWYQVVFLAVIQGITEFLPISSSAHLIIPAQVLNWPDQGLAFDVAVHIGSLIAVVSYFYKDIFSIAFAWGRSLVSKKSTHESRLAWWIMLATIPLCVCGALFGGLISVHLRSIAVIGYTTIGFGILLLLSDQFFNDRKNEQDFTLKSVLCIGFAQVLALLPGTSRSGVTMTASRFLGFSRESSARISFLLSIPAIIAAGNYQFIKLLSTDLTIMWGSLIAGVVLSAISAYLCIHIFLKWINNVGFFPFFVYRLVLGGGLLFLAYA